MNKLIIVFVQLASVDIEETQYLNLTKIHSITDLYTNTFRANFSEYHAKFQVYKVVVSMLNL